MDLVEKLIRITDKAETVSRNRAVEYLVSAGLSKPEADIFLNDLCIEIPALKGAAIKYYPGIARWFFEGQVSFGNKRQVSRLNALLKVLRGHPASDFYNNDFNGEAFDEVLSFLDIDDTTYHRPEKLNYTVVRIDNFEQASEFRKYAPEWCIFSSDYAFEQHTLNGSNQFFFLVRSDIDDVPRFPGENYPYDDYGYSFIAVCLDADAELASSTSRWNFDDYHDNFLTGEEIEELIGIKLTLWQSGGLDTKQKI